MYHSSLVVVCALLVPAAAVAEPIVSGVGARVGGYGFRESADASFMEGGEQGTGWDACRMNGLGVFATRDLDRRFFVEGGLDTYFTESFSDGEASGEYDTPIDRVSGIASVAAGARLLPGARVSPYVQLGVGAELTRARLPALGLEDTALLPMGFFGIGASLELGNVSLGAHLRVNAMGYYDDAQFQTELDPEVELATQGQIFAAFAL